MSQFLNNGFILNVKFSVQILDKVWGNSYLQFYIV